LTTACVMYLHSTYSIVVSVYHDHMCLDSFWHWKVAMSVHSWSRFWQQCSSLVLKRRSS